MRLRSSLSLLVVLALMVPALAAAAGPKDKVEVCHIPPGNPANAHMISVSGNALSAHLGHGDVEGECPDDLPRRVDDDDDSSDDKTSENRAPIARARANQCAVYDDPIALDGRSSFDLDGDTLRYRWTLDRRPTGSTRTTASISNSTSARASMVPDVLGTYRFGLEVRDPDGATDDAAVDVSVHMDVELTDGPFVVNEGATTAVTVYFTELAPQDVTVQLVLDTTVAVVVPNPTDGPAAAVSSIVIKKGDSRETVYLYGLTDSDTRDDSTLLNAIVGSASCGDIAVADVEVEEDEPDLQLEPGMLRFFYVLERLEPWVF